VQELKGTNTTFEIKKYFYQKVEGVKFEIYAITLNKRRLYERLAKDKPRVYNFIARQVVDKIPFETNKTNRVELIIDKSKSKPEINEFNSYIRTQIQGRLDPKMPLDIKHLKSEDSPGLQAVDVFCWGIFQKYEKKNTTWFAIFKEKVKYEDQYL
jgi:hypothetical protein